MGWTRYHTWFTHPYSHHPAFCLVKILMVIVSIEYRMWNLLKMGLHRNVGGQDPIVGLSCPHCLLPPPTLWILVWVSSSYVHANKVKEIHSSFENLLEMVGWQGRQDTIAGLLCPTNKGSGDPICIIVSFSSGISIACLKHYISWTYLVVGWGEGVVYLAGVQLILTYSWAKPAVLAAGKGWDGMLFLLFLHLHSFSSFSPVLHFHLLYYIFHNFTKRIRGPWWPCNPHLSIIALRESDLELIKANILTKVHDDYINK